MRTKNCTSIRHLRVKVKHEIDPEAKEKFMTVSSKFNLELGLIEDALKTCPKSLHIDWQAQLTSRCASLPAQVADPVQLGRPKLCQVERVVEPPVFTFERITSFATYTVVRDMTGERLLCFNF